MNIDIRLKLDVFEHPKIRKLRRRLGPEAVLALLRLWLWAAGNRADGVLCGLDADDVELAAGWSGPEGALATALCELRLLELREEAAPEGGSFLKEGEQSRTEAERGAVYVIHDWAEHQTWASRSDERSRKARIAAQSRWEGREAEAPEKSALKAASKPASRRAAKSSFVPAPANPAQIPAQSPAVAPAPAPSLEILPLPSPAEAQKQEKSEGITQENKDLCSNMRPASPSNAPKAKNQEPFCIPKSSASTEVRTRAKAVPAGGAGAALSSPAESGQGRPEPRERTQAGQGRGEGKEPCDFFQPAAALVPAVVPAPSASVPAVPPRRNAMPPTLQEVEMYCALRGNGISARRFVAYYEARGWRVGNSPMRDWQATIRLWERRDRELARQGVGARMGAGAEAGQGARPPALARAAPLAASPALPAVPELLPPVTAPCGTAPCGTAPYPAVFPLSARGVRGGQGDDSTGLTLGYASLRAGTVHQAVVRERDMMARILLNDIRGLHAQPTRHASSGGPAQSALPPEWTLCG